MTKNVELIKVMFELMNDVLGDNDHVSENSNQSSY